MMSFVSRFCVIAFALLFGLVGTSYAQQKCGTVVTNAQKDLEFSKMTSGKQLSQIVAPCIDKELSVVVYIAEDTLGIPATTIGDIQAAFILSNADFADCCLSFKVCKEVAMPEPRFYDWVADDHEEDCLGLHYEDNHINMYFTNTVEVASLGQVGGYAYFPGGPDVALIKGGTPQEMKLIISHELGHFFGLYHTFEDDFGAELVDASNCGTSGDLLCDTRADPYFNGGPYASDNTCNVLPEAQDANGDWYMPPSNNIMSYYSANCTVKFSNQQLNRMVDQYLNFRSYLW